MSAYRDDDRVKWNTVVVGWPPDVPAMIPDPVDVANNRIVQTRSDGIVVRGASNEDASLTDPGDRYNQRLQVFATVDEAIAAVIGAPR